jgi:hypothetical protein
MAATVTSSVRVSIMAEVMMIKDKGTGRPMKA